jgi:hypothetical protein
MAYNAFPRSAQEVMPAPPQAEASPKRRTQRQPTASSVLLRGAPGTSEPTVAAASALQRFLILLVIISGLTCLYVWQADTISAIKGNTQTMMDEIQDLERQNVTLMLEYSRWDAPSYIETESRNSGMVVGQAPIRVQLPSWSEGNQGGESPADAVRKLAAALPGPLAVGSQTR